MFRSPIRVWLRNLKLFCFRSRPEERRRRKKWMNWFWGIVILFCEKVIRFRVWVQATCALRSPLSFLFFFSLSLTPHYLCEEWSRGRTSDSPPEVTYLLYFNFMAGASRRRTLLIYAFVYARALSRSNKPLNGVNGMDTKTDSCQMSSFALSSMWPPPPRST